MYKVLKRLEVLKQPDQRKVALLEVDNALLQPFPPLFSERPRVRGVKTAEGVKAA